MDGNCHFVVDGLVKDGQTLDLSALLQCGPTQVFSLFRGASFPSVVDAADKTYSSALDHLEFRHLGLFGWVPAGRCIFKLRAYQSEVGTLLNFLCTLGQIASQETQSFVSLGGDRADVVTPADLLIQFDAKVRVVLNVCQNRTVDQVVDLSMGLLVGDHHKTNVKK